MYVITLVPNRSWFVNLLKDYYYHNLMNVRFEPYVRWVMRLWFFDVILCILCFVKDLNSNSTWHWIQTLTSFKIILFFFFFFCIIVAHKKLSNFDGEALSRSVGRKWFSRLRVKTGYISKRETRTKWSLDHCKSIINNNQFQLFVSIHIYKMFRWPICHFIKKKKKVQNLWKMVIFQ